MASFFHTERGRSLVGFINGFGASIVIIGAMFKILHFPGGNVVIGVGLAVEACIFAISAFEPVHKQLDWTRVYPQLEEGAVSPDSAGRQADGSLMIGLSEKLDDMLVKAKVDVEKFEILEQSITRLANATSQMANATSQIANAVASEDAVHRYVSQIDQTIANMDALNKVYREQVEQKRMQIEEGHRLFVDINDSFQTNRELQSQIQKYVDNLYSMNKVYEGMIKAMSVPKG